MCIADIPYGITNETWDQPLSVENFLQFIKSLVYCNKRQHFTVVVFISHDMYVPYRDILEETYGKAVHVMLGVLCYVDKYRVTSWMCSDFEHYLLIRFGKIDQVVFNPDTSSRYMSVAANTPLFLRDDTKALINPCQKPIKVLRHFINLFSNPNDLILDCFAGTCQTLEAAYSLQRSCNSYENDSRQLQFISARLTEFFNTVKQDPTHKTPQMLHEADDELQPEPAAPLAQLQPPPPRKTRPQNGCNVCWKPVEDGTIC